MVHGWLCGPERARSLLAGLAAACPQVLKHARPHLHLRGMYVLCGACLGGVGWLLHHRRTGAALLLAARVVVWSVW